MNLQELIPLVLIEATNLKKFATEEELNKLSFKDLNPSRGDDCVYGQMTGQCYGKRANQLIVKCANKVYTSVDNTLSEANTLNGKPFKISNGECRKDYYHSPIEQFIYLHENRYTNNGYNNKVLIDFIKGKRKTLKFKY